MLPGNFVIDQMAGSDILLANARVVRVERTEKTTLIDLPMVSVDFPVTALMSVIGSVDDGGSSEVASVGTESFVEIDAALSNPIAKRTSICVLEGDVIRIPLADFQRTMHASQRFTELIMRAVRARVFVSEQTAVCSIRHSTTQRLARWLLLAAYRLKTSELSITHEQLATIVAMRRAGVSEASAELAAAGGITQTRGTIAIRDRELLEASACECYGICCHAIHETLLD